MSRRILSRAVAVSAAAWMATSSAISIAQTAPEVIANPDASSPSTNPDEGSVGPADIVVTAQRRSERLQDVPVAITALSSSALSTLNITAVEDLNLAVPSVQMKNTNGFLTATVRGIGSTAVGPGFENPLALYVDGVYLPSQKGGLLRLASIEQVALLKGPQGTLFGRNATAGVLQITTKTPGQNFEGNVSLGVDNYGTGDAIIYVGGPISSTLAADFSLYAAAQKDGYGKNFVTGEDTYRVKHDLMLRSKWVWTPGDTTRVTLIGDYADVDQNMVLSSPLPGSINVFLGGVQPDRGYDSIADSPNNLSGWNAGVSLKVEQDIGDLTLVSTSAYRKSEYSQQIDLDMVSAHAQDITFDLPENQISQELQLSPGSNSGRLKWVAGLFYFRSKAGYDPVVVGQYVGNAVITARDFQKSESVAGYAQLTYEVFPGTNLTYGGRYTTEERKALGATLDIFLPFPGLQLPTTTFPAEKTRFSKYTQRVSLDHRFSSGLMGYVSYNSGFKSGGYNTGTPGTPAYRPETVDAWEGGLKAELFDRRVAINAAGFYSTYKDVQSQRLEGNVIAIFNAASARSYGAELDLNAEISDNLRFSGGFGWTDARYRSYPNGIRANPGAPSTVPADLSGNRLPVVAKYTFNAALEYTMQLGEASLSIAPNIYYNSGYFLEADNVYEQPKYAKLGLSVTWTSPDERLKVTAFGKNLTNERVNAYSTAVATTGNIGALFEAPRTYGVRVGMEF